MVSYMLTVEQLVKRANMKRPDPSQRPAAYHRWRRARRLLGLPWKLRDTRAVLARGVNNKLTGSSGQAVVEKGGE